MKSVKTRSIIIAANEVSTGGLGSYMSSLAMALKSCGWSVHIMVTNDSGNLFGSINMAVPCHDLSVYGLSVGKIVKAAAIINSINPEILLMNNCSLMHYALPLLNTSIKPVAVLHSDDVSFYRTAALFGNRIFRWIAPTTGVAERLIAFLRKDQSQRIRCIPHGIDSRVFMSRENEVMTGAGHICFAGYLAENKGADLLPEIIQKVLQALPDARFTIVGYGPLEQTLQMRLKDSDILANCDFTGPVEHGVVGEILRNSDIFLLPTRIEGFGLSIVEAMMSGAVPVVSRLKGVTDDIVSDGVNGLLIEPDDTEGFAGAIIRLLQNPHEFGSMSKSARKTAINRYSSGNMQLVYEGLFTEADDRQGKLQSNRIWWVAELITEVLRTSSFRDLIRKGRYLLRLP